MDYMKWRRRLFAPPSSKSSALCAAVSSYPQIILNGRGRFARCWWWWWEGGLCEGGGVFQWLISQKPTLAALGVLHAAEVSHTVVDLRRNLSPVGHRWL